MDLREVLGLKNMEGDFILTNSIYDRPKKESNGKYGDDLLTLIYKDISKEDRLIKVEIDKPKIEAYKAQQGYEPPRAELYYDLKYLELVDLEYKSRALNIAKLIGDPAVRYYFDQMKNRNFKAAENLIRHKSMYASDVDIEAFYRIKSLEAFGKTDSDIALTKGYLDIEVDFLDKEFDVENCTGDAPINVVTYVDDKTHRVYTVILRDVSNPQVRELEEDMEGFIKELHAEFGNNKRFKGFKFAIKYYDYEGDLLVDLFNIINHHKPNFLMIWNMRFDIRYIINRLTGLGMDYRKVMTGKDFKSDTCYFKLDTRSDKIITRSDEFICASYTKYIDQMLTYAQVRKAEAIPSVKLDAIGEAVIGEGKLSYEEDGNLATLPKRNFRKFIKYNIKDTLIQYGIEEEVKDVDFIFLKGYESGTPIGKVFKETVYNRNLGYIYFKKQGQILGTNQNAGNFDEGGKSEKFDGAVVGNPALNAKVGIKVLGVRSSSIVDDLQDQDVANMYPAVIRTCNIDVKTQIGRVILSKDNITDREIVHKFTNIVDVEKYDRGGTFVDDLQIREPISFMYRWHNMPEIGDIIEGFKDFDKSGSVKKLINKRDVKVKKLFKNKK